MLQNWIKCITTSKGKESIEGKREFTKVYFCYKQPPPTEGLIFIEHLLEAKNWVEPFTCSNSFVSRSNKYDTYNLRLSQLRLKITEIENIKAKIWTQPSDH